MDKKRLLGFGFIGLAFVVTIYNLTITGAVIGNTLSNFMGFVTLVFFIGGLILTFYYSKSNREKIKELIEKYETGNITSVDAVNEINKIDSIQLVKFKYGLEHSVYGEKGCYPIPLKKGKEAEELAILEYLVAIKNHPEQRRKNELHLAKGFSTKHYSEGIKRLIESIKRKYAKDLEAKLGIA